MTDDRQAPIGEVGRHVAGALDRILGSVTAADVFSEPLEIGGSIVITAAATERAGGFGFGAGEGQDPQMGGGGGGGGGGSAASRPVAVIRIDEAGVEIQPIVDVTRLGIVVLGSLVGLWRAGRRRR